MMVVLQPSFGSMQANSTPSGPPPAITADFGSVFDNRKSRPVKLRLPFEKIGGGDALLPVAIMTLPASSGSVSLLSVVTLTCVADAILAVPLITSTPLSWSRDSIPDESFSVICFLFSASTKGSLRSEEHTSELQSQFHLL